MADHVPQLEPKMLERVAALRGLPAVEAAFEVCAEEVERAMAEQIRISETESPTFAEKVRGELIMELLREYGLTDVVMDEPGNVVGDAPARALVRCSRSPLILIRFSLPARISK